MKKWQVILLVVVLAVVGLGIAKNQIIKAAVVVAVPQVMGTQVQIDSLAVGVFRPVISIKGFRLYNPPGFPNEIFVDVPEVTVQYDLGSILSKEIHLQRVVLLLKEVVLYKNKDGKLNVDSLKIAQQKEEVSQEQKKPDPVKKPAEQMPLQIDVLELDLGRVVVKDYTKGEPPQVLAYDVGVHKKTYKNIKSAQELGTLVMLEALGPTGMRAAGIYAAASVLGVAFLPAGVAGILIGKDSGSGEFAASFDKAFQAAKDVLSLKGKVANENLSSGILKAKVEGADVTVTIVKKENNKVGITISARKYMIPKPEIAQGVLYEIGEKLK